MTCNVPEKHRALAHAEVDGAVIQRFVNDVWVSYSRVQHWNECHIYRIDPFCDYATNKIPERHREAYKAFHSGKPVQVRDNEYCVWMDPKDGQEPTWGIWDQSRPKPTKIKRWQWLVKTAEGQVDASLIRYTSDEAYATFKVNKPIKPILETEREYDE